MSDVRDMVSRNRDGHAACRAFLARGYRTSGSFGRCWSRVDANHDRNRFYWQMCSGPTEIAFDRTHASRAAAFDAGWRMHASCATRHGGIQYVG